MRVSRTTIGVIGGGQLARMMYAPATRLGIGLRLLAEGPDVGAARIFKDVTVGDYTDEATVRAFASLDWAVYFRMMGLVNEHSAAAYLDEVRLPTLITAGDADRMTPLATAEAMHRRIPGSELVVLPGGTHYTPVELPDELNDVIADFFARHPEV